MPRYNDLPENWSERGNSKITPRPFWRRFWLLNEIAPYRVGDKVEFHIHFDLPNRRPGPLSQVLYETFGDNRKVLCNVDECDKDIIGDIISKEGDVTYSIGYHADPNNSHPVFTTSVESRDTIISKWWWALVGALIGAFFTLLCTLFALLLNFIQIKPYLQIGIH